MKKALRYLLMLMFLGVALGAVALSVRGKRLYETAQDWRKDIRYLIENGGTIGEVPAADTFEDGYLEAVFGGDAELLGKLRGVISKGLAEDPSLSLGEVAAMIVTYRKGSENRIEDVVAHVIGGFPLGQRKPGFHREGFFNAQIDRNLWGTGNSMIAFLGRDIVLFADEAVANKQQNVLESVLSGDIMPLAEMIMDRPLHFTAVFPDPRRVVPAQLRPHIQAFILKGHLAPQEGSYDITILTPNPESASYALSMIYDMKIAAQMALQSRFQGVVLQTAWGSHIPVWWALEMGNNLQRMTLEKEQNLVRLRLNFERVMVNATLKSIERMGRDLAQMRGSMDEKLDPRLVDERLRSQKPLHYWGDAHQWGPDWPIANPDEIARRENTEPDAAVFDAPPTIATP
ncbi:MAG TPA: hypothetical protein PKE12_00685 [Kiritimatiellia bacterium]|nr:hypothetical protein [Kiritimatiellia bacterium]